MTKIGLIRAEPQDLDDILPLVAAFHAEEGVDQSPENRRDAVRTLLANPLFGEIWRIEASGRIAGYLAFAYGFSIEFNGRDAFLDEIYIIPECRGRGLGRAALRQLKRQLAAAGVKAAHLEVDAHNASAQRLYTAEGFEMRRSYHLMSVKLGDETR